MDKQLAQKLLKIVNSYEVYSSLIDYANWRSDEIKSRLVNCKSEELSGLQAQYQELRRLATLRDEVLQAGEQ